MGRLAQEERDQYCDKGGGAQSGDLHAVPGEEFVGTGFRNRQTRKRGDREQDDRQSEEGDENGADRTGGLLDGRGEDGSGVADASARSAR